ncbi:MAG: glycosyltransferase [Patescibacteria group bacterium UBA2103]
MKRKKILFAINCLNIGGAPAVLLSHLKLVDTKKYEPWVMTLYRGKQANYIHEVREMVGDRLIEFNLKNRSPFDIVTLCKIYFFLLRHRFSIVMTHLFLTNTLVRILSFFAGLKSVISFEHSLYFDKKSSHITLDRFLSFFTKTIVVAHPYIAEFTAKQERIPYKKFTVIPHPIELPKKDVSRVDAWDIPEDKKVLVCIGRFSDEKGQMVLLEALKKVDRSNYVVLLIGHGSKESKLQSFIEKERLEDVARIVHDPVHAKQAYYIADGLIIPSYREGFSLVAAEGVTAGLPIIFSNIPTLSYIEDAGAGISFPAGDSLALASILEKFLDNPSLQNELMENNTKIQNSFAQNTIAKEFGELLDTYA